MANQARLAEKLDFIIKGFSLQTDGLSELRVVCPANEASRELLFVASDVAGC